VTVGLRQHERSAARNCGKSHRACDVAPAAQHRVRAHSAEQAACRPDGRAGSRHGAHRPDRVAPVDALYRQIRDLVTGGRHELFLGAPASAGEQRLGASSP
jgi:hypothetical protein